jgi:feruloyl esterase
MMRTVALLLAIAAIGLAQTPCEQLRLLPLPNTTITAAEFVSASSQSTAQGSGTLPDHCRVAAVVAPSSDSHIEMEVWLPPAEAWNGKFEAVGNGGWAGIITLGTAAPQPVARSMAAALKEGYATASNDTGHKNTDARGQASFSEGHPEKLRDFADRAVHQMTVKSKAIIAAFYGRGPKLS